MSRVTAVIDQAITSRWVPWVCMLLVFFAPIAIVFWGMPALGTLVASNIPVSSEQKLGRYVLEVVDLQVKPTKLSQKEQTFYIERVKKLAELASVSPVEVYFRSAPANAFALPGNIIVMTDDLIGLMGDPEVIDAVVAHELGHLQHRHSLRRMVSANVFTTLVLRMNGQDGTAASTGNILAAFTMFPYFSRENEAQADEFAFELLKKNGQSPLLFAKAMNKLSESKNRNPRDKASYSDNHPPSQERVKAAEAAALAGAKN